MKKSLFLFFALVFLGAFSAQSQTNQITLKVNMSDQTVSPNGVHVAGSFQDWNPSSTPMINEGNGIYSYTFEASEFANLNFKFINGNDWPQSEAVPSACGLPDGFGGNNRILETGGVDVIYGPVCFGECSNCVSVVEPTTVNLTLRVNMSEQTVSPNGVHVAGNFQQWNPSSTPLTPVGNGIYEVTVEVPANEDAVFKFINGNDWPQQETAPLDCAVGDGFGGSNRVFAVADMDMTFGPVCFGECQDCAPIVDPNLVTVVFQVNMSNTNVSANGVHLAGNFQGWNPNGTIMNDLGGGIYEIAYEVEANSTIEFRFINGSEWADAEIVPAECGIINDFGEYNRTLTVGDSNQAFGPVCFSECSDCEMVVPTMVIFQVDMSNETVSTEGVYIAGSFNDWDPTATQLVDAGNGLYQGIAFINPGTTIQYKFLNGPAFAGEETVPMECGVINDFGGYDRQIEVGTEMITTEAVCFGTCSACVVIPSVELTFNVDMTGQVVSAQGVHVAGTFNDFSPSSTVMTNVSGNLYSVTVSAPQNQTILYKFINGNDWPFVESVPFECGVSDGFDGYNRSIVTDDVDINLPTVCFSSCVACVPDAVNEVSNETLSFYPNPASTVITIQGNYRGNFRIVNSIGSLVAMGTMNSELQQLDLSGLSEGLYIIYTDKQMELGRFIKE